MRMEAFSPRSSTPPMKQKGIPMVSTCPTLATPSRRTSRTACRPTCSRRPRRGTSRRAQGPPRSRQRRLRSRDDASAASTNARSATRTRPGKATERIPRTRCTSTLASARGARDQLTIRCPRSRSRFTSPRRVLPVRPTQGRTSAWPCRTAWSISRKPRSPSSRATRSRIRTSLLDRRRRGRSTWMSRPTIRRRCTRRPSPGCSHLTKRRTP
mmetsp:Transcript_95490/g.204918  ORF Transcript_95490/g.204918 Transcript_95490/m.204918 type:complete len:212 (-) Transcript_95490:2470-3105(-)